MRVLVRDNFQCQAKELGLCEESCEEDRLRWLHVHHIRMRVQGGTNDMANLVTLCKHHHSVIHPWMRLQFPLNAKEIEYPFREL